MSNDFACSENNSVLQDADDENRDLQQGQEHGEEECLESDPEIAEPLKEPVAMPPTAAKSKPSKPQDSPESESSKPKPRPRPTEPKPVPKKLPTKPYEPEPESMPSKPEAVPESMPSKPEAVPESRPSKPEAVPESRPPRPSKPEAVPKPESQPPIKAPSSRKTHNFHDGPGDSSDDDCIMGDAHDAETARRAFLKARIEATKKMRQP